MYPALFEYQSHPIPLLFLQYQILLFTSSVEYHRVGRSHRGVHSMEPVLLQEKEYLGNCVSKLTANRDPQRGLVLLVQNTVSRLAQVCVLLDSAIRYFLYV